MTVRTEPFWRESQWLHMGDVYRQMRELGMKGILDVALCGRLRAASHVWRSSYWVGSQNHFCFSLHRVAWRIHCSGRPLSYWMTGCRLGWDRGQACCGVIPKLSSLGNILFLFPLSSISCYFLSFPFTKKTDQNPRNKWFSNASSLFSSRPGPLVPDYHLQTKRTIMKMFLYF